MSTITRRNWLELSATASAAGVLLARGTNTTGPMVVDPAMQAARDRIRKRYFPDVVLTTHQGKKVRLYEDLIKDKIVVISLMYAQCTGVCPIITSNLVKVQRLLGDRVGRDIFFYSLTVQPEHDSPKVLKQYAKMHGVGPGWNFLTGKPDDVDLVRRKLGFVDPNPEVDKDKTRHSGNVRYGNEPRCLWAMFQGQAKPEWMAESISWVDWPKNQADKG
jgi:protein SCO1/2